MDPVVILHLTDLHFGWEGNDPEKNQSERDQRTNCLNSLLKKLKSLWEEEGDWKPDLLAVTGDIGWAGAADDYKKARLWLNKVLDLANLEFGDMLVCPGNHDIARDAVKRVTVPQGAQEADAWLQVPVSDDDLKGFAAFTEFCTDAGIRSYDFSSVGSHLVGLRESHGLHFVALNTAWYCRGNHDNGKLWVGRNHLEHLRAQHGLQLREAATNRVVVLIHHPPDWWHESEKHAYGGRPNTMDALSKHSHIILSGHTHAEVRDPDRIAAAAWHSTSGASFAGAHHFNSVRLLRIFDDRFETLTLRFEPEDAESCWKEYGVRNSYPFTDTTRIQAANVSDLAERTSALSDTIVQYRGRLAADTGLLRLIGLGRGLQIELPIAEAYVPLKSQPHAEYARGEGKQERSVAGSKADPIEIDAMFADAQNLGKRAIILLGEPGSGKTTAARQLIWKIASGAVSPGSWALPVAVQPVFLPLRRLGEWLGRRTAAAEESTGQPSEEGRIPLDEFLRQEVSAVGSPMPVPDPTDELIGKPLLWVLDGLDEISDQSTRAKVSRSLEGLLETRPDDRILVTCRFAGYHKSNVPLGPGFAEYHVQPLDPSEIHDFIEKWFRCAYVQLRSPDDPAAKTEELVTVLREEKYQTQQIRSLCQNPLMLTLLCVVYHENTRLPADRATLYSSCVDVLLQHWRKEQTSTASTYDFMAAKEVLARLAWKMHQKKGRESISEVTAVNEVNRQLKKLTERAGLGNDGKAFLELMRDECGILASSQQGDVGFFHLSFQEYLASFVASRKPQADWLADRADISWYKEVCLLSLHNGEHYGNAFFTRLLENGVGYQHPAILTECLGELNWFPEKAVRKVLARQVSDAAVIAALRMLRSSPERITEELRSLVRDLTAQDAEVKKLVGELLPGDPAAVVQPSGIGKARGTAKSAAAASAAEGFVRIPKGSFQMGAVGHYDDEEPVHRVEISQDFLLGQYPVTNREYGLFLNSLSGADRRERTPEYWDDRRFNQADQPVVGVSWHDAQAYCLWSGSRLPTEAEWEYACRANSGTAWSFGEDASDLEKYGWYRENSGGQSQPIGTKLANDWDLYDMHGNVWEWCSDWFDKDYYAESPVVDPRGPERGERRVLRGGSWLSDAGYCRSAIRDYYLPEDRYDVVGFRVARTP